MKLRHIGHTLGFLCLINIVLIVPSVAEPVNWSKLDKIQQYAVRKHKGKWKSYSEEKQNRVLLKHRREIAKLRWYKEWIKSRSKKEQGEISRIKLKYGAKSPELKRYFDKLMSQPD